MFKLIAITLLVLILLELDAIREKENGKHNNEAD